jgi:trehalose 6-phosphate phosphatase
MQHLLAPPGRAALRATLEQGPLLAFDFDGTLAPIVDRPHEASVPPAVAARLDRLGRLLPVAVITGRRIDDVRIRLGFTPRFIIGNHGAEDPMDPTALQDQAEDSAAMAPLRACLAAHAAALQAAGVTVEDKGHSLALHYRLAPDVAAAQALISALLADWGPAVRVFGGKRVVNVVAARAPDKAAAMARLVARTGVTHAVFVGDDVNDEPVFVRAGPGWLTVRVGSDDPASRAQFFLDDVAQVADMLEEMLAVLAGSALS